MIKAERNDDYRKFSVIKPNMLKKLLSLPKPAGIALMERVNYKLHLSRDKVLQQAFEQGLFTQEEYEEKYKDMFYGDYGADSFTQYVNAAMNAKVDYFVTDNERMLKRREELEAKFKLKIASPEEILAMKK